MEVHDCSAALKDNCNFVETDGDKLYIDHDCSAALNDNCNFVETDGDELYIKFHGFSSGI